MKRLEEKLPWFLALATASLFYFPLGTRALWDSDEGRYAEIAREMLDLKDWIIPHLNYVVYFEKPPLLYWLTALAMKVFGTNAFAARFWCATFGLLTVMVTYQMGKLWKNERLGLLAGSFLATSIGFFVLTQFLVLDMALTFWTTLTLWMAARLLTERSRPKIHRATYGMAIAIAGGFLTKGLVALALPVGVFLGVAMYHQLEAQIRKIPWEKAFVVGAGIIAPWFILVSSRHPQFLKFFFVHEHFQRYLTAIHHRTAPFYFFLPVILLGFLPWSVFLPKVWMTWFGHRRVALKRDVVGTLWIFWTLLVFIFFSASQSKLVGYLLPIFPTLALLVANEFAEALEEPTMPAWIGQGLGVLILTFVGLLCLLKIPKEILALATPEWSLFLGESGLLALVLGVGIFVFVGILGMRQTWAGLVGMMMVEVLFLNACAALAPLLDPYHSTRLVAQRLREQAGPRDKIIAYGISYEDHLQTLPFYVGQRIAVLGPFGELSLGQQVDPDASAWFVSEEGALEALRNATLGTWGVTNKSHWDTLQQSDLAQSFQLQAHVGPLFLFRRIH